VTKTRQNKATDRLEATREDRPVHFEGLEAYRGIAALSVVVFHAYQYSREGLQLDRFVYEGSTWHTLLHYLVDKDPQVFPQNALVLVAVSIVVATVSYSVIERPATRLYHSLDRKHPKQGT
jgi:peptidoglycan/LPS O-acetylase OafA/YrhL